MKKTNLLLFLILSSVSIYSQNYYPFPDSNVIWNSKYDGYYGSFKERFGLYGDTIINNQLYNKIFRIENDSTLNINNMTYYAAIRENNTKQIFVKLTTYNDEILIYDFSLNIGDTIISNSPSGYLNYDLCIIADIDTIELENNQFRKRFRINDWEQDYWIEGIGSIDGLFHPIMDYIIGTYSDLLCFKNNDTAIYINNPECDKCFCSLGTSIEELTEKNDCIKIYPNPATTHLFIEPDFEKGLSTIDIYNSKGNLIMTKMTNSFPLRLNVKDLPLGIYLIQLINGELIYTKKFLKTE